MSVFDKFVGLLLNGSSSPTGNIVDWDLPAELLVLDEVEDADIPDI